MRVFDSGCKFSIGVAKAPFARPNHGHDAHGSFALRHPQGTNGRRKPSVEQVAVKLNPLCARFMGLDYIVSAATADF